MSGSMRRLSFCVQRFRLASRFQVHLCCRMNPERPSFPRLNDISLHAHSTLCLFRCLPMDAKLFPPFWLPVCCCYEHWLISICLSPCSQLFWASQNLWDHVYKTPQDLKLFCFFLCLLTWFPHPPMSPGFRNLVCFGPWLLPQLAADVKCSINIF